MRKYIVLWIVMFGLFSCENFLDIKPEGQVMGDVLFETAEGCEDALYGVYTNLGDLSLYGRSLSYYLPDVLAAYYIMEGYNSSMPMYKLVNFEYTKEGAPRGEFDNIWAKMYENISYVNNILNNLHGKENSFRYYNFYKGEALALRAFMHFELCNCFAPAYREETVDKPAIPYCVTYEPFVYPFQTVGFVYRKVIDELKEAEGLLKDEGKFLNDLSGKTSRPNQPGVPAFMTERQFHLNLYAVQGLLARVYLMKNDLDSAMIYAEKVIRSEKFDFADKTLIRDEFASKISECETMWGVRCQGAWLSSLKTYFDKASNDPTMGGLLPLNGFNIRSWSDEYLEGMNKVDWGYAQLYQIPDPGAGEQDFRRTWFRAHSSVKYTHFYKIYNVNETFEGKKGVNMIRLPEMYLIMAEGLLKKGQLTEAKKYMDDFTFSRGFVYRENSTPLDMDLINKEYRKEFMGEGRTWFNMKRQNVTVNSCMKQNQHFEGSDEIYVWPIPDDEFEYREGGKEGVYSPEETEEVQPN